MRWRTALAVIACSIVAAAHGARAGTLLRFQTAMGTFDVELFDQKTPLTVENFLAHLGEGDYQSTMVHRSAKAPFAPPLQTVLHDFVIQIGGYEFDNTAQEEPSSYPRVPSCPENEAITCPVTNEPFLPAPRNLRGTLAMAKIGGQPNSASNEWFINLHDDNTRILDGQNGGFTVFGRVLGNGMVVADAIAALPRFPFGPPWSEAPMRSYDARQFDAFAPVDGDNVVMISSISVLEDADDDGLTNAEDNCPSVPNPSQTNSDADPQGDACDFCPTVTNVTNPSQPDFDADGLLDACDTCPTIPNAGTDPDMDGVDQACDTCQLQPNAVFLGSFVSRTRISRQLDDDADGRGNVCDFDYDDSGSVVSSTDFNNAKASLGKLVTQSSCGAAPTAAQRCGEFDHDAIGTAISSQDVNLATAAIGKLIAVAYPSCAACSEGAGWSNTLASGGARLGRPICETTVANACRYAP